MEERQMKQKVLILTEITGGNDFSTSAVTGYTGVEYIAWFEKRERIPTSGMVGGAQQKVAEIADWKLHTKHSAVISPSTKALEGGGTWIGAYNAATAYVTGNVVSYAGKYFRAVASTTANAPLVNGAINSTYWVEVQQFEVIGVNAVAGNKVKTIADLKLIA